MSRHVIHEDDRIKAYKGEDPMVGSYIQIFDALFIDETPEGEGLVFSVSQVNGVEVNLTGISVKNSFDYHQVVTDYIVQNNMMDSE